jgi:type IV pilus assembly protein PilO
MHNRQRILLFALILVVGGYFGYSYLVSGLRAEVAQKEIHVRSAETEVLQAKLVESKLAEFKEQVKIQQQQLEDFKNKLPNEKETSELMTQIQNLAAENQLKITTFTPQPISQRDFYVDWPIQMTLEGNYHNLASFFEQVGNLGRLVNIGEVSLRAMDDTTVRNRTLGATCTATTFVYLDETDA